MEPKPLGWSARYAAVFGEADVVGAYRLRPPYPDETIAELAKLASGGPVVDAGCGNGELARRLAPQVERVDAVDISARMLAEAERGLGSAELQNVRWLHGAIEAVELDAPYALIVAGDSVHWFDWSQVIPRFARLLAAEGMLAVVQRDWLLDSRIRERLRPIYTRHSWNKDFTPLDPVEELERRGMFKRLGQHTARSSEWRPTVDEIVNCHFSQSGFARTHLADPEGFARDVRGTLADALIERDGRYELDVVGTIVWGRPTP